MKKSAVTLTEC